MFDFSKFAKTPETKQLLLIGGIFITALIGIHYVKQIQLTNAKLEKLAEAEEI